MKQASFKICQDVKPKIETKSIETKSIESKKNITSTKPIKHVENIYYFRSS